MRGSSIQRDAMSAGISGRSGAAFEVFTPPKVANAGNVFQCLQEVILCVHGAIGASFFLPPPVRRGRVGEGSGERSLSQPATMARPSTSNQPPHYRDIAAVGGATFVRNVAPSTVGNLFECAMSKSFSIAAADAAHICARARPELSSLRVQPQRRVNSNVHKCIRGKALELLAQRPFCVGNVLPPDER